MRTNLDKSWYSEEGDNAYEKDIINDYIRGASDFQARAIEVLTKLSDKETHTLAMNAYDNAISILENLKAE